MSTKHQLHNLIILDESGSMQSIKNPIINGFNEIVQTIKGAEKQFPEQEHFITFLSFNGLGKKLLHFADSAKSIKQLNTKTYNPDAMTPLFDAMGFAINKLNHFLDGKKNYSVLVTILTDGEENYSTEFSQSDIKKLIGEMKEKLWTFSYIGTDHDVEKVTTGMGIDAGLQFDKTEDGIGEMFFRENQARYRFYEKRATSTTKKMDINFDDEFF